MPSTFIGCKVTKNSLNNSNITHKKVYSDNLFSIILYSCAISSCIFVITCFVMNVLCVRIKKEALYIAPLNIHYSSFASFNLLGYKVLRL